MEILGVTTALSMWAHFAGAFFFGKIAKQYLPMGYAFMVVMLFSSLWEVYQGVFTIFYPWDTVIDMVMNTLGAFIAVRWIHE